MQTTEITNRYLHSSAPGLQAQSVRDGFEANAIICKIKPILGDEYAGVLRELLRTATKSIDIAAYTWKWYEHQSSCAMQTINRAIIEKARHGLPIRARFNHEHKDHCLTRENTRTSQFLKRYKIQVKFDGTQIMSHLKLFIIDSYIAVLGSHNLTARSVGQNNETSIVIFGHQAVKPYCEYYEKLWKG
jgi:phosphatidylserine/phosphatidylglycerophosphate/cardiolipin synthase-like enzyme